MKVDVLGANIPRAEDGIVNELIKIGLIYIGDDNQLHVREQKNTSVTPTTANRSIN